MQTAAEEILSEIRACPPASGFTHVAVPGERERDARSAGLTQGLFLPERTLEAIRKLASSVGK
jgi:LDH2 family malate/lactate/ureidoglycolate dehydrogenase